MIFTLAPAASASAGLNATSKLDAIAVAVAHVDPGEPRGPASASNAAATWAIDRAFLTIGVGDTSNDITETATSAVYPVFRTAMAVAFAADFIRT
jgi:hypothetical protein